MDNEVIKQIFTTHGFDDVQNIKKIDVGFSNKIYSIGDKYILKVCGSDDEHAETMMQKDIFLLRMFEKKLPVPKIIAVDDSKKIINRIYFIYHKIQGNNLYEKWHLYTDNVRRDVVRQICSMMKILNNAPYKHISNRFDFDKSLNWHDNVYNVIDEYLQKVEGEGFINEELSDEVRAYLEENHELLYETKMGLTYWDAHFDNFIVNEDAQIVGILDFERTYITSIDYMLDVVKRMVEHPKKYASEFAEQFIVADDYKDLLIWFKEFYPELFEFEDIYKRLNLYAIKGLLYDIYGFSHEKENINTLKRHIS